MKRVFRMLFLLVVGSPLHADPTLLERLRTYDFTGPLSDESDSRYFSEAEALAEQRNDHRAYLLLAQAYMKDHRVQEAIWTLRRAGEDDAADHLEEKLIAYFESTQPDWSTGVDLYGGLGAPKRYQYPNGMWAVLKGRKPLNNPEDEIKGYRVSRSFGLHVVPVTVMGHSPFVGMVSIQYFVLDCEHGGEKIKDAILAKRPYSQLRKIALLDALLLNSDREKVNWLRRPGNHAVAVDHGKLESYAYGWVDETSLPTGDELQKLRRADDAEIFQDLQSYADHAFISALLLRRSKLISWSLEPGSFPGNRIHAASPLSSATTPAELPKDKKPELPVESAAAFWSLLDAFENAGENEPREAFLISAALILEKPSIRDEIYDDLKRFDRVAGILTKHPAIFGHARLHEVMRLMTVVRSSQIAHKSRICEGRLDR
jgi:hypothetical protein